ncbi:MAG: hypothetical protein JXB32_24765 [Deltaproteobacteria bacterium]|nr:hypothetical protein [Deltaproteobacteria bacterium]
MRLARSQVLFLPRGAVVQRIGTAEDLVLADLVQAENLHDQDVFVLDDGRIRSRNGLYVRLLSSVVAHGDLVIETGETLFVQPYSAVLVAALSKQTAEKWPADSFWDAAIGTSLIAGTGVFVGFAFRR